MLNSKKFLEKYKQCWVFFYGLIYFPWFIYLEKTVTTNYYLIHCDLDDLIPFCEYFIVPYLFWFVYIVGIIIWFLFKESKRSFYQLTGILFGGMTICLLICTLFPNGLDIRPQLDVDKNIFTYLTSMIYGTDTSTNVFPSIHVFTSVAVYVAIKRSELAKKHSLAVLISAVCSLLIILSTLFLKQHSAVDVTAGILLGVTIGEFVYKNEKEVALFPQISWENKQS